MACGLPPPTTRLMTRADAERMAERLCRKLHRASAGCAGSSRSLVASIPGEDRTPSTVFATFMRDVAARRGRAIPCEQTGRTVFYLDVVLRDFPRGRAISLVRDPRDVLLSQKRKWRQKRDRRSLRQRGLSRDLQLPPHHHDPPVGRCGPRRRAVLEPRSCALGPLRGPAQRSRKDRAGHL